MSTKTRKPKPRIIVETSKEFKDRVEEQAKGKGFQSTSAYVLYLINQDFEKGICMLE